MTAIDDAALHMLMVVIPWPLSLSECEKGGYRNHVGTSNPDKGRVCVYTKLFATRYAQYKRSSSAVPRPDCCV